jgi:polysaccharide biosynthesis protein PslJ
MFDFKKNKFVLSLAILVLGTLAVFSPNLIFGVILGALFCSLIFSSPLFGIIFVILISTLGEFGRVEFGGISFLALDLLAPAVLGIWLLRKFINKEKVLLDWVSGSLIAFWGIALLSLILGSYDLSSGELSFALLHLIRFVGISGMLLIARDLQKKESVQVFDTLILSGIILAISGFVLLQILPDFTEAGLADLGWDPHIGRLTSTFLDPNFAGGAFAFILAILGGRFLREKKFPNQTVILGICGILGIALLLTFSRSALLALGVSGLILGIFGNRKVLLAMLIVGMLGFATSPRLQKRVGELWQSVSSLSSTSQQVLDPTAQLRVDSWREGLRIWKEKPILGTGFGAYKFNQAFESEESHAATGSDASLINVGAMTGILGIGVFIIFLWNLAFNSFRKKEWGFLAALAGILVHSVFVNSLFFPPIALYFFVSAGLATKK